MHFFYWVENEFFSSMIMSMKPLQHKVNPSGNIFRFMLTISTTHVDMTLPHTVRRYGAGTSVFSQQSNVANRAISFRWSYLCESRSK